MWFYLMALLKHLFGIGDGYYCAYLIIHYFFVLACILLVFCLSKKRFSASLSCFAAWFFFVATHWLHGNSVLFEMPSLFFGLMSCYLATNPQKSQTNLIVIGALSCCSFLVKQFGAVFFLLGLSCLFFANRTTFLKRSIYYLIGYFVPLLLCFIIWKESFFNSVLFNGYGTNITSTQDVIPFTEHIVNIRSRFLFFAIRICPIVIVTLPFIPKLFKSYRGLY